MKQKQKSSRHSLSMWWVKGRNLPILFIYIDTNNSDYNDIKKNESIK